MTQEELIKRIKENPSIIPDEVIYKEFHERGLWDDEDISIFGVDSCVSYLEEMGYSVCEQ